MVIWLLKSWGGVIGIGFLQASKKGKVVFQKSLSETPFKPDRVSSCTPNKRFLMGATGPFEEV